MLWLNLTIKSNIYTTIDFPSPICNRLHILSCGYFTLITSIKMLFVFSLQNFSPTRKTPVSWSPQLIPFKWCCLRSQIMCFEGLTKATPFPSPLFFYQMSRSWRTTSRTQKEGRENGKLLLVSYLLSVFVKLVSPPKQFYNLASLFWPLTCFLQHKYHPLQSQSLQF